MPGSGKTYRVAVIAGDGIGQEVMPEGLRCMEAVAEKHGFKWNFTHFDFASCDYYEKYGAMLPKDWVQVLKPFDAIYFGAVGDPKRAPANYPPFQDHITLWGSLLQFRRQFDQYVNLRPVRLIPGVKSPLALRNPGNEKIDFWVVRENTEGCEYSEVGGRMFSGTDREFVTQETIMTRTGVDRILDYAFKLAQSRPKKLLTSATKSNGISITMPYWDERVVEKAKQFEDVKVEKYHIDILCAHFVAKPQSFDVVVGSNLFGDILSDLGPAITGTIGIAPSGNINPTGEWPSLFEPVHGSAPDIYGQNIANPVGMIWSGQMMLLHLGELKAANDVLGAIERVLGRADSSEVTPDLGGNAKTQTLGAAIEKAIREMK
ncbi:tartrate dehydrogenase [Ramaria rubella]|nr:tartrate dehydrogenase [Ramaria rubella]